MENRTENTEFSRDNARNSGGNRKKYGIAAVLAVLLVVAAVVAVGSGRERGDKELSAYLEEENAIMARMMSDMEDIPQSGSADIDFLTGMIPHHESAVAMAESYLRHGAQDETLKSLAREVIEVQNREIGEMNKLIGEIQNDGEWDAGKAEAHRGEYDRLFAGHRMDHGAHGAEQGHMDHGDRADSPGAAKYGEPKSVDAAFAQGMILHHQMAVDMAQVILEYGENEEVAALAGDIIDAQEKEIEEMQEILKGL